MSGRVIASTVSLSFYGGTDPLTGNIIQRGHPLEGTNLRDKILVIPSATGSTVGNWALYRLSVHKNAPLAIVLSTPDSVTATGCMMGSIPLVVVSDISALLGLEKIEINNNEIIAYSDDLPSSIPPRSTPGEVVVIKIGGSLITHKESTVPAFDAEQTAILGRIIFDSKVRCILVHGAGSYGHSPVKAHNLLENPNSREKRIFWSEVVSLQYELSNLVCEVLRREGLIPWPVQPDAFFSMDENGNLFNHGLNLINMLEKGYTPVFYGVPMLFGSRTGILSGDDIALQVARLSGAKSIIHFTKNDGVTDPTTGNPVKLITPSNWPTLEVKLKDTSKDATGGIVNKIKTLLEATSFGISGLIVDGRNPQKIDEALAGNSGYTRIDKCLSEN